MYGFVNGAWRNGHTTTLEFIYDESGRPVQLIWNDGHSAYQQVFNYVLNLQGDVVQLRQASDGAVVATYLYNAWGEILSSSGWMAGHNPLRYRGKYYDSALGMYYLQSRYYDPGIGRFINGDGLISTGQGLLGFNMFAYCLNNPVMLSDPTGYWGCSSQLTIQPSHMTAAQQAHRTLQRRRRAVLAAQARGTRLPAGNNLHSNISVHEARVNQLHTQGFFYNNHGIRIDARMYAQIGPDLIDRVRAGESMFGSWGPTIEAAMFGVIGQPELAAGAVIDGHFAEHGVTWDAFGNIAIDLGIGFGAGAVVNQLRPLRGTVPLVRNAIEEAMSFVLGEFVRINHPPWEWHGPGCR